MLTVERMKQLGIFQSSFDQGEIRIPKTTSEDAPANIGRHQPSIQVSPRRAGNLAHDFGTGRACPRPEVLGSPA